MVSFMDMYLIVLAVAYALMFFAGFFLGALAEALEPGYACSEESGSESRELRARKPRGAGRSSARLAVGSNTRPLKGGGVDATVTRMASGVHQTSVGGSPRLRNSPPGADLVK
jgi:hypothetical protein